MRPVVRGVWPQDEQGKEIQFSEYTEARGRLIDRLGEYCSYCEMHLDAGLAVEHAQPKKPRGSNETDKNRLLDWDNFLLACTNCNSTKGNKEIDLDGYLWPDRDNTYRALKYGEGGTVTPALEGDIGEKAQNIIRLVGLDKYPSLDKDPKASDRRWMNRRYAWDGAKLCKSILDKAKGEKDIRDKRKLIVGWAKAKGYWSIWMTVFAEDEKMLELFVKNFKGVCADCFDSKNKYAPVPRPGGQC